MSQKAATLEIPDVQPPPTNGETHNPEPSGDVVRLRFTPDDVKKYPDVEVYARIDLDEIPLEDYFTLAGGISGEDPDFYGKLRERYVTFARENLVRWNLKDRKGEPLPATPEGMMRAPRGLAFAINRAFWHTVETPDETDPKDRSN